MFPNHKGNENSKTYFFNTQFLFPKNFCENGNIKFLHC